MTNTEKELKTKLLAAYKKQYEGILQPEVIESSARWLSDFIESHLSTLKDQPKECEHDWEQDKKYKVIHKCKKCGRLINFPPSEFEMSHSSKDQPLEKGWKRDFRVLWKSMFAGTTYASGGRLKDEVESFIGEVLEDYKAELLGKIEGKPIKIIKGENFEDYHQGYDAALQDIKAIISEKEV